MEHKVLQGEAWLWVLDLLQTNTLKWGERGQTFRADPRQAVCCAEHCLAGLCLGRRSVPVTSACGADLLAHYLRIESGLSCVLE